ncbi:uracil-DNA glycosylase [Batrachochytrium salamandrivorans]|nr:uracil-DNA glycosylase [Batrachochytrium salamandrivorans]
MQITDYFKPDPALSGNAHPKQALDRPRSNKRIVSDHHSPSHAALVVSGQKRTSVNLSSNDPPLLLKRQQLAPNETQDPLDTSDPQHTDTDQSVTSDMVSTQHHPLLGLEYATMSPDWLDAFHLELLQSYFLNVDPYHGPGQAHGLCFSVQKGVPIPPSLVNIYKELESDLGPGMFKRPNHGYLEAWCQEGVLLLNSSLTVRQSEPNSHAKCGWLKFTDAVIALINREQSHVVFMLWGGFAQKKGAAIDGKKHLVLKATHPSPLGANKGGWFGSKHFSKANAYLEANGRSTINWANI